MASLRSLLGISPSPTNGSPPVSGPDLRAERRAKDITVIAVAKRMRLSRQSVHALEKAAEVSPDRVIAYRAALLDVSTTSEGVS